MTDLAHAALMDRTYRRQRLIYDATRAYFLLGRDHLIAHLDPEPGARVLEIACGTGRNLSHVARRWPRVQLYGLDISSQMLRSARAKLGRRARLAQADACTFDGQALWGVAEFDRVILSYSLSMIPDWHAALAQACGALAPSGSLHIVDFGHQERLPALPRRALNGWLARFHVTPRHGLEQALNALCDGRDLSVRHADLFASYAQHAIVARQEKPRR